MTAFTARPTSTNELTQLVNQNLHGFKVGQIVRLDIGTGLYIKSKANSLVNSQSAGMVSIVPSVDTFYLTQAGYVTDIGAVDTGGPFVIGHVYYLDPVNDGQITDVRPAGAGEYICQLFIADSTTSGLFFNNAPESVSGITETWSRVTAGQELAPFQYLMVDDVGLQVFTLPANFNVGDIFAVMNYGAGGFQLDLGAGQTALVGNLVANTSISSSDLGDLIMICGVVADTELTRINEAGNLNCV